jgi:hypothetical protein
MRVNRKKMHDIIISIAIFRSETEEYDKVNKDAKDISV